MKTGLKFKLGIVLLMVALLAGVWFFFMLGMRWMNGSEYKPMPFSKEAWANADAEHRGYMHADLHKKHNLKEMAFDKVKELLGEPDRAYDWNEKYKSAMIEYKLGYMGHKGKMFAFDYRLMLFDYNNDCKVDEIIVDD